jgi:hypothetical protein
MPDYDPSIFTAIDEFIVAGLEKLKLGGEKVKVYPPGAARDKGQTEYPCYAVKRYLPAAQDMKRAMPHMEVFCPSDEQQTISFPEYTHLPDVTGPENWTLRKFPTPYEMYLQIDVLAVAPAQADVMILFLAEAIPSYSAEIQRQNIRFYPHGDPTNLDELAKPLFWTAARYLVTNIWVDRIGEITKPSIGDITVETTTSN